MGRRRPGGNNKIYKQPQNRTIGRNPGRRRGIRIAFVRAEDDPLCSGRDQRLEPTPPNRTPAPQCPLGPLHALAIYIPCIYLNRPSWQIVGAIGALPVHAQAIDITLHLHRCTRFYT